MKLVFGLEAFTPPPRPVCLALGTFDGMHRGHRAVVDTLLAAAARRGGVAVVLTFDPHPRTVIAPPSEPYLLTTIEERTALFGAAGIDLLVVVPFNDEVRRVPAAEWLALLQARVDPRHFVLSSTHAFGRDREGTPEFLQAWAAPRRIAVTVVPPVSNGGMVISSSAIRERLRAGDVQTAARWLGRWYTVRGRVVRGEGRGRSLGVPTANLDVPAQKVTPARGVYAAYATAGDETYAAAVNIGTRPTFDGGAVTVEAHLLDEELDLYGRHLELAFVERLRDEQRFATVEALKAQMHIDVGEARKSLEVDGRTDGGRTPQENG